jgi:hypothetical protein
MRPILAARADDTNWDREPRRPCGKKEDSNGLDWHVKSPEEPERQQRLNDKAAAERVQAEEHRQTHNYSARLR